MPVRGTLSRRTFAAKSSPDPRDTFAMRAEMLNHVAAIEKSLKLLAQRLDWETAPHRLEAVDRRLDRPPWHQSQELAGRLGQYDHAGSTVTCTPGWPLSSDRVA